MGAHYGSRCYADEGLANATFCGSEFPKSVANGSGGVNVLACTVVDDTHVSITTTDPLGTATTVTMPTHFEPCDTGTELAEMSQVFGLILGSCAIVYALKNVVFKLVANQ